MPPGIDMEKNYDWRKKQSFCNKKKNQAGFYKQFDIVKYLPQYLEGPKRVNTLMWYFIFLYFCVTRIVLVLSVKIATLGFKNPQESKTDIQIRRPHLDAELLKVQTCRRTSAHGFFASAQNLFFWTWNRKNWYFLWFRHILTKFLKVSQVFMACKPIVLRKIFSQRILPAQKN